MQYYKYLVFVLLGIFILVRSILFSLPLYLYFHDFAFGKVIVMASAPDSTTFTP